MTKHKGTYVIPLKKRARTVGSVVAGTAVAIALFIFASNFVVDGEFIIRGGTVVVEGAPKGTQVLIDSTLRGEVKEDSTLVIKKIARGEHTLIATKSGHWPWLRTLEVTAGQKVQVTPLLIPQELAGKVVDSAPDTTPLPSRTAPITQQQIIIWADGNAIYSQLGAQQKPVAVFTSEYPVRSLALYPGRTDTLLVAAGDLIFALDIEAGDTRNFLPMYKSTAPEFAIDAERGTIFIKDGNQILELQL